MTEPLIIRLAQMQKEALAQRDLAIVNRLADYFVSLDQELREAIRKLSEEIENLPENLNPDLRLQWLRELKRYKELQEQAYNGYREFKDLALRYGQQTIQDAISFGVDDANTLYLEMVKRGQRGYFSLLPDQELINLKLFLGAEGNRAPLGQLFDGITQGVDTGFEKAFLDGIARGLGSDTIAEMMIKFARIPLSRALTIVRTETNRAYREATRQAYNRYGTVKRYKRFANRRTACMACLLLDGQVYTSDQAFDDHPNGACSMLPCVDGAPDPVWNYGALYFEGLTTDEQQQRMGKYYYEAWKKGEFVLTEMVRMIHNPTWGSSPSIKPLSELFPDWKKKLLQPPKVD